MPASNRLRRSSAGAHRRDRARGFTLVEVIVALTAGLLVSAAAYTLARNAMKSFQDESRIATGQVGVALGASRLTADLQRAGYMASPNLADDPRRCPTVNTASVPLVAVQIDNGGSAAQQAVEDAGYALDDNLGIPEPDMLVITGNMTSSEQFEYRGIDGDQMHLAADRGPAIRAFEDVGRSPAAFCEIFVPAAYLTGDPDAPLVTPSRFARVVDPSGKESYLRVTGCNATEDDGELVKATLTVVDPTTGSAPSSVGSPCGARPGGGLVNPVSIIRYRLGQLCNPYGDCATHPYYAAAMKASGPDAVTGEASRLELLREEIAPASAAAPFSIDAQLAAREIVTEFAVDLDFAFVVADDDALTRDQPAVLTYFGFGEDAAEAIEPQRVRSIRFRLSTRARVPDRDEASPPIGVTTRFRLPGVLANNKFARLRTLHGDVSLPNLQQVTW